MKYIISILMFGGTVFADCPTPTPPPNVSVIALSPYAARFQVNPASSPTAGYVAERKEQGEDWLPMGGPIINTGYPNGVINDFYELLPGHSYIYRTRARTLCNDHTLSVYTSEVTVTLPVGSTPNQNAPEPPTNLVAAYTTRVNLTWTAGSFQGVSGQGQTYQIQRSVDNSAYNVIGLPAQTSFADNNVLSGHTYHYRVRSFNGFGWATEMAFNCPPNRTDCGTAFTNVASISVP